MLILNPDIVVAENTFVKALEFVKKQQNFGALGVKLIVVVFCLLACLFVLLLFSFTLFVCLLAVVL